MSCCETQNLAVGYGAPLLRDIALHAERGKMLHDVVVMDDRPERDGALSFAHGLLHQTDRAVDPETEPGRSSYADGHCMPPSA